MRLKPHLQWFSIGNNTALHAAGSTPDFAKILIYVSAHPSIFYAIKTPCILITRHPCAGRQHSFRWRQNVRFVKYLDFSLVPNLQYGLWRPRGVGRRHFRADYPLRKTGLFFILNRRRCISRLHFRMRFWNGLRLDPYFWRFPVPEGPVIFSSFSGCS